MKTIHVILLLFCIAFTSCKKQNQGKEQDIPQITHYIEKTMTAHNIPGLAIAVIKNGEVIHKGYYGKSSIETGNDINEKTIFRLYSLTKLMTALSVFRLIEEGKLGLNDTLSEHFDGLPELWKNIEIAHLLSHSSGLPDIHSYTKELGDDDMITADLIKLLYKEKMDFITGDAWRYNQTNHLLLRLIIEDITAMSYEDYILKHQFKGLSSNDVLFSSNPSETIEYRAKYYSFDKNDKSYKTKKEMPGVKGHPLNGINITLDAYISWNNHLDANMFMQKESKTAMWQPFDYKNSDRKFLYGWDVYSVNNHDSFGFSGGGVSGYRKFVDKGLSIIVLTNGYQYYSVQDIIIDQVAGMLESTLQDDQLVLTERIMQDHFLDIDSTIELIYKDVTNLYSEKNLQAVFKSIGYTLFFQLDKKEDAIELFKQNVLAFPNAYDTHGSLAYLYFLTDQYKEARAYYVKALELNPENSYSERTIKKIDEKLKKQLN